MTPYKVISRAIVSNTSTNPFEEELDKYKRVIPIQSTHNGF